MNIGAAGAAAYAAALLPLLPRQAACADVFVLPPFTSLPAAATAFRGSPVSIGGQNMHWEAEGAWTGEVSAAMLLECGCRYVELAHSERLQWFGETYALVRKKLDRAIDSGLVPILCLGETAEEKAAGRADAVLREQILTALEGQGTETVPRVVLAYEPRWAIGSPDAASPAYVTERHQAIREVMHGTWGAKGGLTRIMYGGAVNQENAPALARLEGVDGLFVGRAAWTPTGLASIVAHVLHAAEEKEKMR